MAKRWGKNWNSDTVDSDCSHEIKTCLLFGRKAMTNLDTILKSRDITLPTKVHLVKNMFFPVVMYGCESWTIKKAAHWKIDAFELWCWRRLLRVPWTARRPNQSILKEISPEYFLEGLMLKLKLQLATWCKELTHWKRPDAGKDWRQEEKGDGKGWDDCMVSPTRRNEFELAWELVMEREAWRAAVHGVTKSWAGLSDWTELKLYYKF